MIQDRNAIDQAYATARKMSYEQQGQGQPKFLLLELAGRLDHRQQQPLDTAWRYFKLWLARKLRKDAPLSGVVAFKTEQKP